MTKYSSSEILQLYYQASWLLKLRLISSRLILEQKSATQISFESACLQMRKCIELISKLSLISSELFGTDIQKNDKKKYKAKHTFKLLSQKNLEPLPFMAELSFEQEITTVKKFTTSSDNEARRLTDAEGKLGNFLHQAGTYLLPVERATFQNELKKNYEWLSKEHSWIWERFWKFASNMGDEIIFVDLGYNNHYDAPEIYCTDTTGVKEISFEVQVDLISDFSSPIIWK